MQSKKEQFPFYEKSAMTSLGIATSHTTVYSGRRARTQRGRAREYSTRPVPFVKEVNNPLLLVEAALRRLVTWSQSV